MFSAIELRDLWNFLFVRSTKLLEEDNRKRKDYMAAGGTEAFPDLGSHCQLSDCNQLDFLPFKCDGCQKVNTIKLLSFSLHVKMLKVFFQTELIV